VAEKRKLSGVFWVSITLLMLLFYPLSLGPMIWLDTRGMLPVAARPWLEAFYFPLQFLFDNQNIPLFSQFFESYLDWWIRLGRR
jgi:hypothetical protein